MKSFIIFFSLTLFAPIAFGQTFQYPAFQKSSKAVDDFIPSNWFLKDSSTGDLNGDDIRDLALVIEYKDTINENRPNNSVNNGSPRILLILFKNPESGDFDLVLQNNTFIIRYNEGGMDPEAYGEITITNKVLEVAFDFLRGFIHYKFRFQQNDFFLIGATNSGGISGQIDYWDINFLTGKAKHEWGGISEKLKQKWKNIPGNELIRLRKMKMIYSVEILPSVLI